MPPAVAAIPSPARAPYRRPDAEVLRHPRRPHGIGDGGCRRGQPWVGGGAHPHPGTDPGSGKVPLPPFVRPSHWSAGASPCDNSPPQQPPPGPRPPPVATPRGSGRCPPPPPPSRPPFLTRDTPPPSNPACNPPSASQPQQGCRTPAAFPPLPPAGTPPLAPPPIPPRAGCHTRPAFSSAGRQSKSGTHRGLASPHARPSASSLSHQPIPPCQLPPPCQKSPP